MRSCICISGLSRTYKQTFPNFKKNVLQPLKELGEVSIFISIWDTKEINILNPNYQSFEDPTDVNDIISKYKPTGIEIESFKKFQDCFLLKNWTDNPPLNNKTVKHGILTASPAQYLVLRANKLKKRYEKLTKTNYDLVIRTRFDVEIDKLRPLEFDLNKLNCLYDHDNLIGDYFYAANSQNMNNIANLFNNYSSLLNLPNTDMGPERNLSNHCFSLGIETNILKNYNFNLVRECYIDKLKTLDLLKLEEYS